jgi:hypothetical protein
MSVVIVAGALANKPHNGGGAWERLSWVTGLRRLGCDVYFVEQIASANGVPLEWFRSVTEWFDLGGRAALVDARSNECVGMSWSRMREIATAADLLVNLSGHLTLEPLLAGPRRKVYVDVDPGYTQIWHADPATPFTVAGHDEYFTIGENIGTLDCPIPTGGIHWRPVRQPVVLDDWPVTPAQEPCRFTTVASWRGAYGPLQFGGRTFGVKAHEFRKVLPLPRLVDQAVFEIALDVDAPDTKDLWALREHGWRVTDPRTASGTPEAFRRYVQESAAEFSVAQGVYVETTSGWFSDRTVRYLASGKPALVQDTGCGRHLPIGEGLVAFRTLDEAAAGAERILADYERHCEAARAIARDFFDSDKVLGRFLQEVGVAP